MTFVVELEDGRRMEYPTEWEDYEDIIPHLNASYDFDGPKYGKISPCCNKYRGGCDHIECAQTIAEHNAEFHSFFHNTNKVRELDEYLQQGTIYGIKAMAVPHTITTDTMASNGIKKGRKGSKGRRASINDVLGPKHNHNATSVGDYFFVVYVIVGLVFLLVFLLGILI